MNRHELARLGQYFKDMGREGCGHGVAADASNNVLEGIGAVILKFAAAPDNLPKDDPAPNRTALAKALFQLEHNPAIADQAWFDFYGKADLILAALANPQQ